ncbi:MAG: hypothetical protein ACREQ9_17820 [Candidatus Binatia bacterium]
MRDRKRLIEIPRGARGQALVENVVWLPVLVLLFLGMFYMRGIVRTKMAAIEAARYVSWEHTWIVREGLATPRDYKSDATLQNELDALGLGRPTVKGQKHKETIQDYADRMAALPGVQQAALLDIPDFLADIIDPSGSDGGQEPGSDFTSPPGDSAGTGGGDSGAGSIGLPGGADGAINGLLNVVSAGSFIAHGFFARQTSWTEEDDASVVSSEVMYRYAAAGSRFFPAIDVFQTSSILSHPFLIKRGGGDHSSDANEEERHRLIGEGCPNDGHIFDLWLYPSGPIVSGGVGVGVSTVASAPKCVFSAMGDILGFLDFLPGIDIGYQIPSGTLKEYPELDAPRSSSTSGLGPSSP